MTRRIRHLLVLCATLTPVACGSAAEEACQDYKQALISFYQTRCDAITGGIAIQALEQALPCDEVLGIHDETALREECFPALETMTCGPFMQWPESCEGQLMFQPPPVF